ncbi:MAG: hypothetical protein F6K30_00430 [Cyanothece sp. SIO2G6]|nr:hypothetical protein [Cyanothece sp. SIO2G6]
MEKYYKISQMFSLICPLIEAAYQNQRTSARSLESDRTAHNAVLLFGHGNNLCSG